VKTKLFLMLLLAGILSASAGAEEVAIINAGFEDPSLGGNEYTGFAPPGWSQIGSGEVGAWHVTVADFDPVVAPEGQNVGYAYQDGVTNMANGLAQVLAETLEDDKQYTLTVEVGNSWNYYWPGYSVQLLAGGTIIAEDYNTVWPNYMKWDTSTVVYTYDPDDSGLVGQPLEIRLLNLGINTDGTAIDNAFEVEFDDVKLNAIFDMNPSPYDGESVTPPYPPDSAATGDEVILSWTNMDPNEGVTDVYVDVWFGIDPNSNKPALWAKVADAAEGLNSATVDAPIITEPTTYYWRVDSYIYGSSTGDPIEGPIYTFYTTSDIPPLVDAGENMITWSGEAVAVNATVEDDGVSALSYAWSSVPADGVGGVNVVFNPNEFVEDPDVTITKLPGVSPITIINPGFEEPALADGDYSYRITEWREGWYNLNAADPTRWTGYSWSAGTYDPNGTDHGYDGVAPEGENVAFVTSEAGYDMGLRQILSATLQPNTQYELSALVGNPVIYNGGTTADYRIELVAGDVVIATETGPSPIDDTYWTTASLTVSTGSDIVSDPNLAYIGEPLEIRLIAVDTDGYYEVDFDDVQLVASGEGAPAATVTLTVAVNDELNPTPAKDSMKIDVYDDACEAAREGLSLAADNPGDFDADCDTDPEDLAEMASTWLNDTGLMEAVVRPDEQASAPLASTGTGQALYERWDSAGSAESMLTESTTADYTEIITSTEWGVGDDNALGDYRGRITAWLIPPVTGEYIFWIVTDDNGMLWLSTDHDPANAQLIASESSWAGEEGWGGVGDEAQSAAITLEGGRPYWLRGGYQEGGGGDHIRIGWASSEAGIADHTIITGEYISDTDPGPMNPSPRDGETVSAGLVDLSWMNLSSNADPNGSVWVDVWFGTDANDLTGIDYKKVVDAGENTTTVQVNAPVIGATYYWQVDSYLDGSPSGDPNVGEVWVFYAADLPPSVDVGDDMVTWSGEPVELDATIEDDGHSAVSSVLWSAEPVDGTEVTFDPVTADVEDPIVTIIKVPYSAARIVNAGFEDPVLADGGWGGAPGWTWVGSAGSWNPSANEYGGNAPEGDNVGWVGLDNQNGAHLAQILTETLASDTTYELTVEVGRNTIYDWPGYKVQLLAGGTILAEDDNSLTIAEDTFEASTVMYDSTGVETGLVGQNLEIRLHAIAAPSTTWAELNFDDVRLIADPPFPIFTGVQTVTLTLSASDEAGSGEDTMEIDVYNNNCLAAKGAGLAEIDPADIDADCMTTIEDFAEMALTWLVYYELTEPVEKP
jgi:hypothetical protein